MTTDELLSAITAELSALGAATDLGLKPAQFDMAVSG